MWEFFAGFIAALIIRWLFSSTVSDGNTLWIVGVITDFEAGAWEFVGVYDDEYLASEACTTERHFIGPAMLGGAVPDASTPWPEAYFPIVKIKKKQA